MLKVHPCALLPLAVAAAAVAVPVAAAPVAAALAGACAAPGAPAMLVRVSGFKVRTGALRVQSYGGDPARFFDKGTRLRRVELPVPAAGPATVCLPVPAPGHYAVSVRHYVQGVDHAGRGDGGGLSGNPRLTLFDLLFKRKPDPGLVSVAVGRGVREVPIVLDYLSGTSFRPVAG